MRFYTGFQRLLLIRVQVALREYITTKNAFPDPADFRFEVTQAFDDAVEHFMRRSGKCWQCTTLQLYMHSSLLTVEVPELPKLILNEAMRSLVSFFNVNHLRVEAPLTLFTASEGAVVISSCC